MLCALLAIGTVQSAGFDLAYSPCPSERYELSQSSYAIHEGSLIERVTFEFHRSTESVDEGYRSKSTKKLTEHLFGDERLDLPKEEEPFRFVEHRSREGILIKVDLDPSRADEYRLERLTQYLPPAKPIRPGEAWERVLSWPEETALPKIKYKFKLLSATSAAARIESTVEELDTNNPLMAKGAFTIALGKSKSKCLAGEWTTESAFMPGGSEERFRLVQRLKVLDLVSK